jgi:hypothetical protein
MAKKSRRVRHKGTRPKLSETQLAQPTQVAPEVLPAVEATTKVPAKQSTEVDFREEYHYVVSDLKRIGLLAAAIFGGIIILSLIL